MMEMPVIIFSLLFILVIILIFLHRSNQKYADKISILEQALDMKVDDVTSLKDIHTEAKEAINKYEKQSSVLVSQEENISTLTANNVSLKKHLEDMNTQLKEYEEKLGIEKKIELEKNSIENDEKENGNTLDTSEGLLSNNDVDIKRKEIESLKKENVLLGEELTQMQGLLAKAKLTHQAESKELEEKLDKIKNSYFNLDRMYKEKEEEIARLRQNYHKTEKAKASQIKQLNDMLANKDEDISVIKSKREEKSNVDKKSMVATQVNEKINQNQISIQEKVIEAIASGVDTKIIAKRFNIPIKRIELIVKFNKIQQKGS